MTKEEKQVTRAALDLFARVLCGQLEAVGEVLADYYLITIPGQGPIQLEDIRALRGAIGEAKSYLGLASNASRGIYNPDVHPAARKALAIAERIDGKASGRWAGSLAEEADDKWVSRYGEPWLGRPTGE